ncbi:MAG: hypothetical protein AAGE80_10985 [Pseudomonadota bacterium]
MRTTSEPMTIGFSDLTEDEQLIVSMFRDWTFLGPTRPVVEHSLARLFKRDRIYPAIGPLMDLFEEVAATGAGAAGSGGALSKGEIALLAMLADDPGGTMPSSARLLECRIALRNGAIRLRQAGEIKGSDRDRLLDRISKLYSTFARSLPVQ